jgi:hypothetical protein
MFRESGENTGAVISEGEWRWRKKTRRKHLHVVLHNESVRKRIAFFCKRFGAQRKSAPTRAIYKAKPSTRPRACFVVERELSIVHALETVEAAAGTHPLDGNSQSVLYSVGDILAVKAAEDDADEFWFVALEEPVLASTDGAIITPSFTAVYLERDGGDKYILGEAANIHRESVVRALEASECFEAEDDTSDTVFAVFHIQRSVQATLKREQVHLAGEMMIDRPHQRTRHDKRMWSRQDPHSASDESEDELRSDEPKRLATSSRGRQIKPKRHADMVTKF